MRALNLFFSVPTSPFTDHIPNGDALLIYSLVKSLAKRGHTIHVATPRSELKHPLPPRVSVYENRDRSFPGATGKLSFGLWSRKILKGVLRNATIDLIHEPNPVFTGTSLGFFGLRIPLVLGPQSAAWPHDADQLSASGTSTIRQRFSRFAKHTILNLQFRQAGALLLSTPAALEKVKNPEKLSSKIFTLPHAVDDRFFQSLDQESNEPAILFLANMLVRKGIFTLLDAFNAVATRVPEAILVLAGGGQDLDKVKHWVDASPFKSRIRMHGPVDREQVAELMRRCAAYCLPSHGEPFGISAIEAMASGKPLVVTDAGGLAWVVPDEGGRKVPVRNSESLADALVALLTDASLRHKMGRYNRSQVENHYSLERVTDQLESIYRTILNEEAALSKRDGDHHISIAQITEWKQRAAFQPSQGAPLARARK